MTKAREDRLQVILAQFLKLTSRLLPRQTLSQPLDAKTLNDSRGQFDTLCAVLVGVAGNAFRIGLQKGLQKGGMEVPASLRNDSNAGI